MHLAISMARRASATLKTMLLTSLMQGTDLVLGLGFRGLKRASKDCQFDVLQLLRHLWMTHVLVHNNAIHQLCILQLTTNFAVYLQTDSSLLMKLASLTCSYSLCMHCINLTS